MREPKHIYRIPPCDKFDIAAMESWLEDMAMEGYILETDSFLFGIATFRVDRPQRLRYRLEATDTPDSIVWGEYDPEDKAQELNGLMGWEYRGRRGQFHIYVCADPNAPELHTDPRVQAMSMKSLGKYLRTLARQSVFWLLLYPILHGFAMPVSCMIVFGLWTTLLFGYVCVSTLFAHLHRILLVRKMRRHLESGEPLCHRKDYRSGRVRYYLSRVTDITLAVCLLCIIVGTRFAGICGSNSIPLEEYSGAFPFATVSDLYPEAELSPWLLDSEVTAWSNWFTPESYEYEEFVNIDTEAGESRYACWQVDYHRCRFPWMARQMAQEYLTFARGSTLFQRLFGDPLEVTELEIDGVDHAVSYSTDAHMPYILILRGDTLVRLNYSGNATQGYTVQELAQLLADSLAN